MLLSVPRPASDLENHRTGRSVLTSCTSSLICKIEEVTYWDKPHTIRSFLPHSRCATCPRSSSGFSKTGCIRKQPGTDVVCLQNEVWHPVMLWSPIIDTCYGLCRLPPPRSAHYDSRGTNHISFLSSLLFTQAMNLVSALQSCFCPIKCSLLGDCLYPYAECLILLYAVCCLGIYTGEGGTIQLLNK